MASTKISDIKVDLRVESLSPTSSNIETFKEHLRLKVHQYGDFTFEDDYWYYKKAHRTTHEKSAYSVSFLDTPEEYIESLKYYALMSNEDVKTIKSDIYNLKVFLSFFKESFPDIKLSQVNRKIINKYEAYLRNQTSNSNNLNFSRYLALKKFFKKMCVFPEFPNNIPTKNRSPFTWVRNQNTEQYISTEVVAQFDKIMKDEKNQIPEVLRLLYWLQRSFPNRISEVSSLPMNCLKSFYSMYVINIPSTKQNGGYITEEIKTVPIFNSGHGKYIVDLIKLVKEQTTALLKTYKVAEKDKNFLLLSSMFVLNLKDGKIVTHNYAENYNKIIDSQEKFPNYSINELTEKLNGEGFPIARSTVKKNIEKGIAESFITLIPFTSHRFNSALNRIAKLCRIIDENGDIFQVTSHQFRHNATTDRLYIGGYTIDQVMNMRNDKGTTMPNTYIHQQKEMHKKMQMDSSGLISPSEAPVEFKARIFNLDDQKILERISKDPRAYLTWEANGKKGVGICSMISGCKPNGTSIHFECYECNWFVPKAEYYEDYKKELEYWNRVANDSAGHHKRQATFENAMRNVTCLERIVKICENGIEKFKKEIEQKIGSGELH